VTGGSDVCSSDLLVDDDEEESGEQLKQEVSLHSIFGRVK